MGQKKALQSLGLTFINEIPEAQTILHKQINDAYLSSVGNLQSLDDSNSNHKSRTGKATDAYQNVIGNYGYNSSSVSQIGSQFPDSRTISWNFQQINQIYRTQPLVSKISTTWANEMVKSGIEIKCDKVPTDRITFVEQEIKKYNSTIGDTANWGFVFGLSAAIIYIDGEFNEDDLKTPLNLKNIKKNSFLGLKTVIRWQGIMPEGTEFVDKVNTEDGIMSASELGEPLYYNVWFLNDNKNFKVHRSRLLLFNGTKLPGIEDTIERGAGVSLIEQIWVPLLNYLSTINYVLNMLQLSQQRVLYLAEAERAGLLSQEGQAELKQSLAMISKNADYSNMIVLDPNDEFEYVGANFENLDKIIQSSQEDLAAAANMPLNKLFGKLPTGLNNSSEANLIDFYDFIERLRITNLRPVYDKLIPIIYKSKYGEDLSDFSYDFKSLFVPTEEEKALIIDRKTRPIETAWEMNAITLKTYLLELKEVGKISDSFTNITDELLTEIDNAGLANTRNCDFTSGYIINSQIITSLRDLKRKFKINQEGGGKNNAKSIDKHDTIE